MVAFGSSVGGWREGDRAQQGVRHPCGAGDEGKPQMKPHAWAE